MDKQKTENYNNNYHVLYSIPKFEPTFTPDNY